MVSKLKISKNKWVGTWAGPHARCPKCNNLLLQNVWDKWCSHQLCDYNTWDQAKNEKAKIFRS